MRCFKYFQILFLFVIAIPVTGVTAEAELLLKSRTSWDGGSFQYPEGTPEISILRIRMEEGQETPFHCHPVPTFGYLLEGKLEVKIGEGQTTIINEGQVAIEVMDTAHRGKAIKGPVEILVFYAGAQGLENSIPKGEEGCG